MKNYRKILLGLIFFLSTIYTSIISAQNSCFVILGDVSGIDNSQHQTELNDAACELIQALPAEYQDSFKVYDFGFYSQNEYMADRVQEIWDNTISQIPTKYYLLFGKQSDHTGIYSKFIVDINLPFVPACIDEISQKEIIDNVRWTTEDEYIKDEKKPYSYFKAEIKGIKYLKEKVLYLQDCCNEYMRSSCSNCIDDLTIQRKLIEKGYTEVNIDSFEINSPVALPRRSGNSSNNFLRASSSLIDASSQIKIFLEETYWELNSGLEEELSEYPTSSKKGVIATNADMCTTDLYLNIDSDFYNSFEISVVYVLWTRKDPNTFEIIDKKLYFKEKFPDYPSVNPQTFLTGTLKCYPEFGIYNTSCNSYALPINVGPNDKGKYFISTDVNGHFFGYRYDGENHWDELTKTEYLDEMPQFADDKDDLFNDCENYLWSDYSEYARRQSRKSTKELVKIFERWTKNNVLVGMEGDLYKIIHHYYFKNGETLEWDCSSSFSKYIYSMPTCQQALSEIEQIVSSWLLSHADLDRLFEDRFSDFAAIIPDHINNALPGGGLSSYDAATAAISIGGFQGHEFKISSFKKISCSGYKKCYEIELIFTIIDIFGAGTSDRDRGGDLIDRIQDSRVVPGLTQMWLLQHCRNNNSLGYSFIPFEHRVNMGHKFKICIP